MSAAEQVCETQGGQLATVGSQWEQDELVRLVGGIADVWLGGRRKAGGNEWEWLDGRPWTYQNWGPSNDKGYDCVLISFSGLWESFPCSEIKMWFVCETPLTMSGYHKIGFRKDSVINRPIEFTWNSSDDLGNISSPEFRVNWKIEDGNSPDVMELVCKDLEGSVSTPGLGFLPPPNYYKEKHEYSAIIELPHNITEVIGDGALVVDVDIVYQC